MPNVFHRLEGEKKYRLDSEIDGEHSSGKVKSLGNKTTHIRSDLSRRNEGRMQVKVLEWLKTQSKTLHSAYTVI